jgi:glutamyl-tRNA synthetase
MPELKTRANTLNQLAEGARFLFVRRPLDVDEGAAQLLTADARAILRRAHDSLAALADWEPASLEASIREVAESKGIKLGKLAQPLRAALTGRTTSPGIFDVLALLGRDESLARIADQMVEPTE